MKKIKIKNFIIICFISASLFSGNINYPVYCVAEECCKTECCDAGSGLVNAGLQLSVNNSDCCEYSQALENEDLAVSSPTTSIKTKITAPSILQNHFPNEYESSYNTKNTSTNHIPESHSISILRI